MRAAEGIWAIGDATGVMPFTHVGMYQARIACADIAGQHARADYTAIPRVVFSDPEIVAVGLTEAQAREQGIEAAAARVSLPDAIARPWTYEADPRGDLGILVDRERGILIGAWAVAPLAGEWIHYAALAIKTHTPLDVLRDTVAQFPNLYRGIPQSDRCAQALTESAARAGAVTPSGRAAATGGRARNARRPPPLPNRGTFRDTERADLQRGGGWPCRRSWASW